MYCSYCPEDGIEFHDTAQKAEARAALARNEIERWAEISNWTWHDQADEVCWGKVMGKAHITDRELTAEEKEETPEWECHRTYELRAVPENLNT